MPSDDQRLAREESICYRARRHWIVLVGPSAVAVALGISGVLLIMSSLAFGMDNFALQPAFLSGLVMVQVAVCAAVLGLFHRAAGEIAMTNRRVILSSGALVKRTAAQWLLREIASFEIEQGDLGRMLDYGSIVVHAAGNTSGPFRFVSQPFELMRRVEEEIANATTTSLI